MSRYAMNKCTWVLNLLLLGSLAGSAVFAQEVDAPVDEPDTKAASEAAEPAPAAVKRAPANNSKQLDKLNLGSTVIKGNAELPKVLYIVPWQGAAAGDLDGRPVDSLLDEVFAPVDRDAFLRHVDYFGQLSTSPATDGAQ